MTLATSLRAPDGLMLVDNQTLLATPNRAGKALRVYDLETIGFHLGARPEANCL